MVDAMCQGCRYWFGDSSVGNKEGECHFYPPQVVVVDEDILTYWPEVSPDDYCGQFAPPPVLLRRTDDASDS